MDEHLQKIIQKYGKSDLQQNMRKFYLKKCNKIICRDVLSILLILAIVLLYVYCEHFTEWLWIIYRLLFVHIVNPYIYDFAKLSHANCLLDNRHYVPSKFDCHKIHPNISEVVHVGDAISPLKFEQLHLVEKRILKVANRQIIDWPIGNLSDSLAHLAEFYTAQSRSSPAFGCELQSSVASEHFTRRESLLRKIIDENPSDWFTVWNHCGEMEMKAFREYYIKPSFLPQYAQMTEPSWLVLSRNYRERILLPDADDKIMLLAQIHGSSRLFLSAHTDTSCSFLRGDEASREKSVSMSAGEMLIVTNAPDIWYDVSLQTRQMKHSNNSSQLSVVLVLFADVNYDF